MAQRRDRPADRQIFRCWVEIRELASGSVRKLPLKGIRKVCLKRPKKGEPPVPDQEVVQLEDGADRWEVKSREELAARLREKYPDGAYERTLHYVRDREAEEQRESALNELAKVFADVVLKEMLEEESRPAAPTKTECE